MKWVTCFLMALTLWAQLDSALLGAVCASQVDPLAAGDDDDDPPCSARPAQPSPSQICRAPLSAGLKRDGAHHPRARNGRPAEVSRVTPFTPPALYVFMSLQI